jgi:alkanesulfonate monooxygenase SsuD/methylene tetrahydromethanopterin reductase-like flavin-dependent oxidoreductase (luciferase family)
MRFSIWPLAYQPWDEVLATARHAEATGWDGVWFADHFMPDGPLARPLKQPQAAEAPLYPIETPVLEAASTIAALAAVVPRVRIGSLVYGNTYRHPAVVANMAATVDHISGGRFTLGIGAGWQENEHEQYGIPLPPVRERVSRFKEAVAIIRSLLREPTTTVLGDYYAVADAMCEPKPLQDALPILIGASGEQRMLGLVAELADQWNCWGLPDLIAHKSTVLDQHCERLGRDPADIARTAQALVFLTDDQATADRLVSGVGKPAFGGPPERLTEVVAEYAKLGLDELIIPDRTLGTGQAKFDRMDRLIEEVSPHFR